LSVRSSYFSSSIVYSCQTVGVTDQPFQVHQLYILNNLGAINITVGMPTSET